MKLSPGIVPLLKLKPVQQKIEDEEEYGYVEHNDEEDSDPASDEEIESVDDNNKTESEENGMQSAEDEEVEKVSQSKIKHGNFKIICHNTPETPKSTLAKQVDTPKLVSAKKNETPKQTSSRQFIVSSDEEKGLQTVPTKQAKTRKTTPAIQIKTKKSVVKQVDLLELTSSNHIKTLETTRTKQANSSKAEAETTVISTKHVKTPKLSSANKGANVKSTPSKQGMTSSDGDEGVEVTPTKQPKTHLVKQAETSKSAVKQVEISKPTFPNQIKTPKNTSMKKVKASNIELETLETVVEPVKTPKTASAKKSVTPELTLSRHSKMPSDGYEGIAIYPTDQSEVPKINPTKKTKIPKSIPKQAEILQPTPADQSDMSKAVLINQATTLKAEPRDLKEDWKPLQKAKTPKRGKVSVKQEIGKVKWESKIGKNNQINNNAGKNVKFFKGSCLKCRKHGHKLIDCPDNTHKEKCFKCGNAGHKYTQCPTGTSFKFATCFVCNKQGHIARECPENPRGVFPHGGKCRSCQEEGHMMVDCPKMKRKFKEEDIVESKPPKKLKKEKIIKM